MFASHKNSINSIMVGAHEIFIGDSYRKPFFDGFVAKNMLNPNK